MTSPSSVDAVQAQHEVEVQRAAALVLGHLHVRRAHPQLALLGLRQARELTRHLVRRPPPQLGRERVPQHRVLVVEALRADRLAEPRIVLVVDLVARERHAVRARLALPPRPAPARLAVDHATRVHRPEPGRRQRQEDHRMPRDGLGHALAAAHPRRDELERITAIRLRTRRADGLAPVAAALQQRLVRLVLGREHRPDLAGRRRRSSRSHRATGPAAGSSRSSAAGARSAPTRPDRRPARARPPAPVPPASRSRRHLIPEPLISPPTPQPAMRSPRSRRHRGSSRGS